MKLGRFAVPVALLVMVTSPTISSRAGDIKFASLWREFPIVIDGTEDDWAGHQVYLEELKGAIGVANDSDYLFVSISTQREDLIRQTMMAGFTVWLDGDGKKKREFGVRFQRNRPPHPPGELQFDRPSALDSMPGQFDSIELEATLIGVDGATLEQLSPTSARHSLATTTYSNGRMSFEFRVPITRNADHPQAIGGELGKKIAMGIETARMQGKFEGRPRPGGMGGPPSGGGPLSGGGPPSGGPGGGMGRGGPPPGGGPGERPKSFELWAKVTLAGNAATSATDQNE